MLKESLCSKREVFTNAMGKNELFTSVCAMLILIGCGAGGNYSSQGYEPISSSKEIDEKLLDANRHFAFQLYKHILQANNGENVFVSPLSVAMVLSMTYNGAATETQRAMAEALQLQNLSIEDVNRSYAALKNMIEQTGFNVELRIANSLWGRKGVQFKSDFLEKNKQYYDALVTEIDFADKQAAKTINEWVRNQTKGKIAEIVDANIDPLTILFLSNAVYFKGEWTKSFDEQNTQEKEFTLLDGSTKMVPMMLQNGDYEYFKGESFEAVQLPYGNERFGMTVFLPDANTSLDQFHQLLNGQQWEEWVAHFETAPGTIQLPRFKMEYKIQLNDVLKAMGMEVAFSEDHANFEHMVDSPPNAFVKEVRHQSFIEVNEEGAEAAASTSVGMHSPQEAFNMQVDRPFFFTIQDYETGILLFMGSITDVFD